MSNIWDKFDKQFNTEELAKEVAEADTSTGEYREVPKGDYEVKVAFMELRASKKGDPMVTIWFRIVSGEYSNSIVFYNQVINQPFQVSIANRLLSSLAPGKQVTFESFSQYGNLIMDIYEEIDGKFEFALNYGENKGYPTFKIEDVFEV